MPRSNSTRSLPSGITLFAGKVARALLQKHPKFSRDLFTHENELMARIPAPAKSKAGCLGAQTFGKDIWIRLGYAKAHYGVDTINEMLGVISAFTSNKMFFVVVTQNRKWVESTLVDTEAQPVLETETGTVRIISWSGKHDRAYSLKRKPSKRKK